jgi:hypothetical protein
MSETYYTTAQKVSDYTKGKIAVGDVKSEWLNWADDYIDRYTGLKFGADISFTDLLDGNDLEWIFTKHFPLLSITILKVGGTEVDSANFKWYPTGKVVLLYSTFDENSQNVEVKGTYGFATVPGIVEQIATMLTAGVCYAAKDGFSPDLKSIRIGDYAATYLGIDEGGVEKQLKVLGKKNSLEGA